MGGFFMWRKEYMAVKKVIDSEKEFNRILQEYSERYDIEGLSSPNDVANLNNMIRNQILIQRLQSRLDDILTGDKVDSIETKKILDSIVSLNETNIQLERQLGIDRKTRKQQQQESFPDYLAGIKKLAREFLNNDDILLRVFCKGCKIMVGRISGVYDTTEYNAAFQCPQCKKYTTVTRKERDIFFDVKNADWRRKYPIEVVQPKRVKNAPHIDVADDLVIGALADEGEEDATKS
jgi:hypothetical protein